MIEALTRWEGQILLWIQDNLRWEPLDPLVKAITFLGNGGWFWIALAVVLLLFRPTRRAALAAGIGLLLSLIVNNLFLKEWIARIRPYEVTDGLSILVEVQKDFSFPSGHSGASFAAAVAMFPFLPRRWGVALLVLAGLIALSRLYVGVHFPTDVLAGALIGTLLGLAAAAIARRLPKGLDHA